MRAPTALPSIQAASRLPSSPMRLLETGFIKEVFHPTWLVNPVLVKKKNA
jgi:hypothetical protein